MAKYPTVAAGRTVLRFLLGSETPTLASAPRLTLHTALKLESNAHGDVLVLDAIDGARLDNACSCTEKTVAWVRHALRTWPSVAFIAKSEDDTYVQLQALDYELRTHLLDQPRVLYGYHTLSMLPTRPTPRREAKPSDACVALAGRCRESRGCTEGSCKGMRKHTSSYSGVGVRDRDKVARLGRLYDARWRPYVKERIAAMAGAPDEVLEKNRKMFDAGNYLADHFHEVPALLLFCFNPKLMAITDARLDRISVVGGGSVYPAVQNTLLACRAEGDSMGVAALDFS